jgi:hypothetical protein
MNSIAQSARASYAAASQRQIPDAATEFRHACRVFGHDSADAKAAWNRYCGLKHTLAMQRNKPYRKEIGSTDRSKQDVKGTVTPCRGLVVDDKTDVRQIILDVQEHHSHSVDLAASIGSTI